jgi:hypothetical protein
MTTGDVFAPARQVADAVLLEGLILYPYRATSPKNQVRFQFGVVAPRRWAEADGSERWCARTQCLVEGDRAVLDVRVRCLQPQSKTVEAARDGEPGGFRRVASLAVDGEEHHTWDESVERQYDVVGLGLEEAAAGHEAPIELPGGREVEMLVAADGATVGRLVRERQPVAAVIRVSADVLPGPYPLARVGVAVENLASCPVDAPRDEAMRCSVVAVHTMLRATNGAFVSMIDPPEFARAAVAECVNDGLWPVLVGPPGRRDLVLASPIILDDHPEVAPESPGDLCDACEIDEILALRIMTLTDEEKRQARGTDARAAAILDRTDNMPHEVFERLHGAIRGLRRTTGEAPTERSVDAQPWWTPEIDARVDPWSDTLIVAGVEVGAGSRVRLRPGKGSDAQDLFLVGSLATVQAVFHDVDGSMQIAVTVDDDPGAEMQLAQGRFSYFRPEEIEPLGATDAPGPEPARDGVSG